MLRAAVGDLHLDGFEEDVLDKQNLPERLGFIMHSLRFILQKVKSLGIKHIDFLGDLVHTKSLISTIALDYFKEILLSNPDIEFTMLSGNHDLSSTGELQKSAISVFTGYSNVKCFPLRPGKLNNNIYVIPYCETFLDEVKNAPEMNVLLTHIGLNEGKLESGMSKVSNVSVKHLTKFKLILAGHYHTPQQVDNFHYIGSVANLSWSDKNQTKRFIIYDDETLKVQSIPIDGLIGYKEFTITDATSAQAIIEEAEKMKNNGHYVRIRKEIKDELTLPSDMFVIEKKEIDVTNRGITITQTLDEKLKKYLEIKEIPEDKRPRYLEILQKNNILTKVS